MCFFILLLSFSEPKKDKYDNVSTGMSAIKHDQQNPQNLKYMEKTIVDVIAKNKLESAVEVKLDADGLAIEFKNAALFKSGSATANPRYQKVIGRVLKAIGSAPKKYKINIEGHTDDERIRGGKYKSNWELASARSITMLGLFNKKGVADSRMSVVSFAHTRPKVEYKGKKGKKLSQARAANRRVVIRVD